MKRNVSDTVLLSGWLFADLFLGLMVIFLAALPGSQPNIEIQTLTANVVQLDSKSQQCTSASNIYQCTITLGTTHDSKGDANWKASSDINDAIHFSPTSGTLAPNETIPVTISAIPCQTGSFTFLGEGTTTIPVTIMWKCALTQERLDFNSQDFVLTVNDINGLLNNSQSAIDDVKNQVRNAPLLKGRSVGLAIVSSGAPTESDGGQAQQVSAKIYDILKSLGNEGGPFQRASYYADLINLGDSPNTVHVDVYLYIQS